MHVLVWLSSLLCVVVFVVLEDLFSDPAAPILKEMREMYESFFFVGTKDKEK